MVYTVNETGTEIDQVTEFSSFSGQKIDVSLLDPRTVLEPYQNLSDQPFGSSVHYVNQNPAARVMFFSSGSELSENPQMPGNRFVRYSGRGDADVPRATSHNSRSSHPEQYTLVL